MLRCKGIDAASDVLPRKIAGFAAALSDYVNTPSANTVLSPKTAALAP
jgi:hypothetical protein